MNYNTIIENMANNILSQIKKAIDSDCPYDKTFLSTVIDKDGSGNAAVFINGRNYTAKCGNLSVSKGDTVFVCAPQNNWNDLFIVNFIPRK